ncbi:hypothetical protein [Penaeicola halotolerans]|uniref:hypothetical protein n=1 Tax=Penaeicola halotolerans TaxID=2793196 RepID=UPI001CF8E7BF|nr:hypothetical protein [Penaeicola halotolerans]
MKKYYFYFILALTSALIFSCKDDDEEELLDVTPVGLIELSDVFALEGQSFPFNHMYIIDYGALSGAYNSDIFITNKPLDFETDEEVPDSISIVYMELFYREDSLELGQYSILTPEDQASSQLWMGNAFVAFDYNSKIGEFSSAYQTNSGDVVLREAADSLSIRGHWFMSNDENIPIEYTAIPTFYRIDDSGFRLRNNTEYAILQALKAYKR